MLKKYFYQQLLQALCLLQAASSAKAPWSASTVKQALELPDDARVVLEGKIVAEFRPDHYQFVDKNGDAIEVEINNEDWRGISVNETTPGAHLR